MASIIEKEVRAEGDRAKVARVLYNRLDKGEPLGLDSTVIYAENLKTNTTTPKDRASTSKYNTYKYAGPAARSHLRARQGGPGGGGQSRGRQLDVLRDGQLRHRRDQVRRRPRPSTTRYVKEFQAWCQAKAGRCDS